MDKEVHSANSEPGNGGFKKSSQESYVAIFKSATTPEELFQFSTSLNTGQATLPPSQINFHTERQISYFKPSPEVHELIPPTSPLRRHLELVFAALLTPWVYLCENTLRLPQICPLFQMRTCQLDFDRAVSTLFTFGFLEACVTKRCELFSFFLCNFSKSAEPEPFVSRRTKDPERYRVTSLDRFLEVCPGLGAEDYSTIAQQLSNNPVLQEERTLTRERLALRICQLAIPGGGIAVDQWERIVEVGMRL